MKIFFLLLFSSFLDVLETFREEEEEAELYNYFFYKKKIFFPLSPQKGFAFSALTIKFFILRFKHGLERGGARLFSSVCQRINLWSKSGNMACPRGESKTNLHN